MPIIKLSGFMLASSANAELAGIKMQSASSCVDLTTGQVPLQWSTNC